MLRYFSPDVASTTRVTVAADPDGLLLDDVVGATLAGSGFDVVQYRDPVEFRFYYESRHRGKWDRGEHTSLVVSVPSPAADIVPFDVLAAAEPSGRVLEFSLGSIFPNLDPSVLEDLDRGDLDAVWSAVRSLGRETLGSNQTKDLVLRSVFKLAPEMVNRDDDLVAQLLRLHFAKLQVPEALASRFANVLRGAGRGESWPIEDWVRSADSFLRLVQDRWERRVHGLDPTASVRPGAMAGPVVNFDSPDVQAVLDNLFLDGRLRAVEVANPVAFRGRSQSVGVIGAGATGSSEGVLRLLDLVIAQLPEPGVPPTVWVRFAQRWAELVNAAESLRPSEYQTLLERLAAARTSVDSRLWEWLHEGFGPLVKRSFLPYPAILHQVPHHLAHRRSPGDRVALVVVDGLSIAQWGLVKHAVGSDWTAGVTIDETAVFAWIPTVTSVSRQALLSGQPPMYFESSVYTTSAEERHWKTFWEDRGWRRDRIALVKHRDAEQESSVIDRVRDVVDSEQAEFVALILNSIDRLVHAAPPDGNILNAAVREWARNGHVVSLVHCLLERGFTVALTSDHGNVEADGVGRLNAGSIPEDRGLRAVTFPDLNTLKGVGGQVPGALPWPGPGLPQGMHVLFPPGRGAFAAEGSRVRTHGGASVEEVLVPFVKVSKTP